MTIMPSQAKKINREEAKRLISLERNTPTVVGHKWYLIENNWWVQFVQKAEDEEAKDNEIIKMPPIDNSSLVIKKEGGGYELKPKLEQMVQICLIPEELFVRLKEAYGVALEERDVIKREVIFGTLLQNQPFVEIYPMIIKVASYNSQDQVLDVPISQGNSLEEVRQKIMDSLEIPEAEQRGAQFLIEGERTGEFRTLPAIISQTQLSALLSAGYTVYVFTGQPDELPAAGKANDDDGPATRAGTRYSTQKTQYQRGLCGLTNLGNTCFMNSALQCLSNVPELTDYFLRGDYAAEVNEQNPLGTHGRLVKEYADLLKEMWSGQITAVRPFRLKSVIGEFAPRFNGYAQQDSQELTAFLLDGLHEDLNRIKKKPYIEDKEFNGKDEAQAAAEAWQDYRKRNNSIIVDLLHGQLKSTLTCNVCNKVSIKFDPFCFLSVPIPAKERQAKSIVTFVRKEKWAKFSFTHTNKTTGRQIKQMLREQLQLPHNTQIALMTFYGGDLVDDDGTLVPTFPAYTTSNKMFYAYAVGPGPIMLVENRIQPGPQLLSPIFPTNRPSRLTRRSILTEVLPKVREVYWRGAGASTASSSSSPSADAMRDDEINGNDQPMENDEPMVTGPLPIDILLTQTSAATDEAFPQDPDEEPPILEDGPILKVVIKWDEAAKPLFHTVDVNNLVDREVNMTTPLKKSYSLKECINLYTSREQLNEEDSWYCPRCKNHQRAFKKLDLWFLPQILIIHLKRFIYSRYTRDKIDTEIEIPVRGLDLSDKILSPAHKQEKYDLIGISNHMGGLGSGHYTANALNGDQWCDFNDSNASKIDRQMGDVINSREAYMLVYRRCSKEKTK